MNKPLVAGVAVACLCVVAAFFARRSKDPVPVWEGEIERPIDQGDAPAADDIEPQAAAEPAPSTTSVARAVITRPEAPSPAEVNQVVPAREPRVATSTDPMRSVSPPVRVAPPTLPPRPEPPPPAPSTGENATEQQAFVDAVRGSFQEAMPELRDCYELVLDLEPNLSDRLVANLTVSAAPDGGEFGVSQLDAIEAGEMGLEHLECFADVIGGLQLPAPNGEESYTIRYPIAVNPGDP